MGSSLRELTARAAAHESPEYRVGFEAAWDLAHGLLAAAGPDVLERGATVLEGSLELVNPRVIAHHAASELREVADLLRRGEEAARRNAGGSLALAFGDVATQVGLIADAIVHLVDVYLEAEPPWIDPEEDASGSSTPLVAWLVNYTVSGSVAGRDPDRLAGDIVEAVGHRPQMIDLVRAQLVAIDGLDDVTGDRNRRVIEDLTERTREEGR